MTHWRAKGGQTCRGSEPIRPSFEPDAQRGSNVIDLACHFGGPCPRSQCLGARNDTALIQLADHQTAPSPDDRLNSRLPSGAGPFIPPFEFGSWLLVIAFFTAPSVFVGAAVLFYALLVA